MNFESNHGNPCHWENSEPPKKKQAATLVDIKECNMDSESCRFDGSLIEATNPNAEMRNLKTIPKIIPNNMTRKTP